MYKFSQTFFSGMKIKFSLIYNWPIRWYIFPFTNSGFPSHIEILGKMWWAFFGRIFINFPHFPQKVTSPLASNQEQIFNEIMRMTSLSLFLIKTLEVDWPEMTKRRCWARMRCLSQPWVRVTRTNISRWAWKGDQQRKKDTTTTTDKSTHSNY